MFSKKFTKKISFALCLSLLAGSVFSMNTFAARKKTTLAKKSLKLTVGEKQTIKLKNKNKKAKYTFVSSKKKVATVSKNGIVSAKKKGVANIKVTEIIKKKKRTLGSVKISVSDKQNTKETAVPSNQATSQPTNAPANSQTGTPQTTLEPTATPVSDPYTKKLFEVDYKVTDKEVVEGSTCKVTMDFFNADITSEYMSEAKTYKEASIVKKEYKNGTTTACAKYIIAAKDSNGRNCRVFVQDEMKYVDGKFVSTPIIVTPNSTLSFMQTADIEGRTTVDADGNYKTVFFMNPDSKKTFTPPEVVMPDADSKYKKLLFTFNITPGNSDTVKSDFCYTSMIHFNGSADCDLFKGKVVRECIDTRVQFNDQVQTLSARYVLSGTDKSGNPCRIYVENNGIDNGRMVTTPQIITDSPDYAWIETAPLHGTVDQTSGLKILMWTTEE